jgi:hypothetical protein
MSTSSFANKKELSFTITLGSDSSGQKTFDSAGVMTKSA